MTQFRPLPKMTPAIERKTFKHYAEVERTRILRENPEWAHVGIDSIIARQWKVMNPDVKEVYRQWDFDSNNKRTAEGEDLSPRPAKQRRVSDSEEEEGIRKAIKPPLSAFKHFEKTLDVPPADFYTKVKWNNMDPLERAEYYAMAQADNKRYEEEMARYQPPTYIN